jgi:DNA-binding response OmpR family regulator
VDSSQQFIALVLARDPAVAAALGAGGFTVAGALTGSEAIRLFDQQQFDLVLLDMDLLRPNGLNACRRIRELAPNVKIIMIADEDAEEDRVRALEAGADDCVNKPLQLRELAARARAVLRLCSPRQARSRTRPNHIDAGQKSPPGAAGGGETSLPDSKPGTVPKF